MIRKFVYIMRGFGGSWICDEPKKRRFQSQKDMNIYVLWDLVRMRTYSFISLRSHNYLGLE